MIERYNLILISSNVDLKVQLRRILTNDYDGRFAKGLDFQPISIYYKFRPITINLWDTAGQDRFRFTTQSYVDKADMIVICENDIKNLEDLLSQLPRLKTVGLYTTNVEITNSYSHSTDLFLIPQDKKINIGSLLSQLVDKHKTREATIQSEKQLTQEAVTQYLPEVCLDIVKSYI